MKDTLPVFRYQPNPLGNGAIQRKDIICYVCRREREYACSGPFYLYEDEMIRKVDVCPWCLAEGIKNANIYQNFSEQCWFDSKIDLEVEKEILQRTPGFLAAQQTIWLTHCGSACEYLGIVDKEYLIAHNIDIHNDLEREALLRHHDPDDILDMLSHNDPYIGHLFRCLSCGTYRLLVDCD